MPPKRATAQSISAEELESIVDDIVADLEQYLQDKQLSNASRCVFGIQNILVKCDRDADSKLTALFEEYNQHFDSWKSSLKVNDQFETFSNSDQKWSIVKILFKEPNGRVFVHYLGWPDRYDQWIDLSTCQMYPLGSLIQDSANKKQRSSASSQQAQNIDDQSTSMQGDEHTSMEMTTSQPLLEATSATAAPIEEAASNADEAFEITAHGRRVRKLFTTTNEPKKKHTMTKRNTVKDHNDWHCTNCGMLEAVNGSDLVMCDGPCKRSFHQECMSSEEAAKHEAIMDTDENSDWLCWQCRTGRHDCFICGRDGIDFWDVVRCLALHCGKYYHRTCLSDDDKATFLRPTITKKVQVIEGSDATAMITTHAKLLDQPHPTGETSTYPIKLLSRNPDRIEVEMHVFKCPRHLCDTCYEFYGNVDTADLCPCHYCPRAFHTNCIPPRSKFNSVCLACPLHPDDPLPGDAMLQLPSKTATHAAKGGGINSSRSSNSKKAVTSEGNESHSSSDLTSFFEQLIIPEITPAVDNPLDHNHYRLPLLIKDEIESIPQNFKLITKNNWDSYSDKTTVKENPPDSGCDCQGERCDRNCMNRALRIECCAYKCLDGSQVCRVGNNCGNRALTNKEYAKTKVFREGNMGFGLLAVDPIPKGQLVIEYIGEIIDENEVYRRLEHQRVTTPSDKDFYIMELDDNIFVDGKHQGNVSRYINHSCNPNCELQRWNVRGKMRIAITAIRDIAKNEPLSYDYQFDTQQADVFKCYCGAHNCRGTMAPRNKQAQLESLLRTSASRADDAKSLELRQQIVRAAKEKEKVNREEFLEAERARSYTSNFLPGDRMHEIIRGPSKTSFALGQSSSLFLVRNVKKSMSLLARRRRFIEPNYRITRSKDSSAIGMKRKQPESASSSSVSSSPSRRRNVNDTAMNVDNEAGDEGEAGVKGSSSQ